MATLNDLVLIYLEDTPVSFARIETIHPDPKKDWYHIRLLILQIPLQVVTWILKDAYINGEPFQMNGKSMRLEMVHSPVQDLNPPPLQTPQDPAAPPNEPHRGQIISFADIKRRHEDDTAN